MRRKNVVIGFIAIAALAITWIAFRPSASTTPLVTVPPKAPVSRTVASDLPIDLETWQAMIAESQDLHGLMLAAMKIGDADLQQAVVASIIDRWLVVDAAGFIKHLNALEVSGDKGSLAIVALALQSSLTRLSLESASSDEILVVVQRLISYLASTDPAKALEWARRFLLDDTLDSAVVSIARGMARTDVQAGLRIAESIQSPLRRSQAFAAVGTVWAAQDPVAALTWAVSLKNHSERALTVNAVLLVTARHNPPAAARSLSDQAKRINDQYLQERAAQLAAAGITEADLANDPDSYREMLESGSLPSPTSPDIELMATAGKVIGSKLAGDDALDALAWAESLDGDFLKLTSLSGVLDGWAATDPVAALGWVREKYPDNGDLHTAVFRAWAAGDPAAAAAAAQQIEKPNQRAAILEDVVKVWATKGDSAEATAFVTSLPPSPSTDSASYALATAISYQQPDQAWRIARGIANESAQFRALKSAFSVMVSRDPVAAADTLGATPLPGRTTERLAGILRAATVQ